MKTVEGIELNSDQVELLKNCGEDAQNTPVTITDDGVLRFQADPVISTAILIPWLQSTENPQASTEGSQGETEKKG
jgi:hypothetical protein